MSAPLQRVEYPRIRHLNILLLQPGQRDKHRHSEYEVLALLRGRLQVHSLQESFPLSAGEFCIFNPREVHGYDLPEEDALVLLLQYSPYFCREYYPHARRMIFRDWQASRQLAPEARQQLLEKLCRAALDYFSTDRLFELRCLSGLLSLMADFGALLPCDYLAPEEHHRLQDRERKLEEILNYMESSYQSPLRLEEVARQVGLQPGYLSHFFRRHMGMSFQDYLSELRFQGALRVMDRDLPLRDISQGSGFSDPKYLQKMFLRKLGCTPAEYRQRLQPGQAGNLPRIRTDAGEAILSPEESRHLLRELLSSPGAEHTDAKEEES